MSKNKYMYTIYHNNKKKCSFDSEKEARESSYWPKGKNLKGYEIKKEKVFLTGALVPWGGAWKR